MTLSLSVEELSRDFESYIKRVVDERVTIIVILDEKAVAEIVPLPLDQEGPRVEDDL